MKTKEEVGAIKPTRTENFPGWYQEVIKAAELSENAPVRGCMVIKPYGYSIWENIQTFLGAMIKEHDVQNAYFPLLIPLSYLSKEAEHIDGFAKECAVVTHHRLEKGADGGLVPAGELTEPFVIRPTSETIIGEVLSGWINSYRDLPLKLNQWCNVMRWEMRPRMFLRTSEFLWQEGHNCFATDAEARADAKTMLDMYVTFLQEYLAIPGFIGEKTADERFPGAEATYTYEAIMQDGKAVQMCTSHHLGQTFAKGAGIKFSDQEGHQQFAHTTSWGLSTRTIGALVMVHGDDDGVIMPPRIAPHPVRIIPILRNEEDTSIILNRANKIKNALKEKGIRCSIDKSMQSNPNKNWAAIKQGVPIRLELGIREVNEDQITYARRDQNRRQKYTCNTEAFIEQASSILDDIHQTLYTRAHERLASQRVNVHSVEAVIDFFASDKEGCVCVAVSVMDEATYALLKSQYAVTPRCIIQENNKDHVILAMSY